MNKAIYIVKSVIYSIIKEFGSLKHNIKTYVFYGILYDVMFNLYKPYAAKFAERLGGGDLHISLVTSLPGLFAVLALVPGSIFLTRFKDKKNITAAFFIFSRLFLPLMALTPFLPNEYRATVFVIVLAAMNFPDSISQASLQSFLGDLFLPRQRADAIAVRSKFGNAATTTVLLISCIILNFAANTNEEKIIVYQIFFMLAFLTGIAEVIIFLRLRPKRKRVLAAKFEFSKSFKKIMKDKRFMTFCLISFGFHFGLFMGYNLSNIMHITVLGANEFWVGIAAVCNVATIVASSTFWGRMLVRKGTSWVLTVSAIGMGINCVVMAFSPTPQLFAFFGLFGGVFTCGVNLGILNGLLENTPDEDRVVYVGVFQTFINFTLAVAPMFALYISNITSAIVALLITGAVRAACGIGIYFIYGKRKIGEQH